MTTDSSPAIDTGKIRKIASANGYYFQSQAADTIVFSRTDGSTNEFGWQIPITIEVYLSSGVVATYIPHPRQKAYRLFHFGAAYCTDTLCDIFRHPFNDLHFSYRLSELISRPSDAIPISPPPIPLNDALERQLIVINREISDLNTEKNELKKQLRYLKSVSRHFDHNEIQDEVNSEDDDDKRTKYLKSPGNKWDRLATPPSASGKLVERIIPAETRPEHAGRPGTDRHALVTSDSRHQDGGNRHADNTIGSRIGDSRLADARLADPRLDSNNRYRSLGPWHLDSTKYSDVPKYENSAVGPSSPSAAVAKVPQADRIAGNKAIWSMAYPDTQDTFGEFWKLKPVTNVALGRGYILAYEDGTIVYSDICPILESKLRQQGILPTGSPDTIVTPPADHHAVIKYIVLGSESNFYVKFDDGRMEWCGQDSFGEALRRGVNERRLSVLKVAFGQNGAWLVLWNDGSFDSDGMPTSLIDRLHRSPRLSKLNDPENDTHNGIVGIKDVTAGPTGEWFIIYKDHSVQADNLPDSLYKCLSTIRENSGRVRSIAFGENRSWFIRFWDGSR